ncbi:MAG TPA: radical SAM protein [Candidatus Limnocylindrales bacterium]|nr:radical SAM protein [Candidatus Limnocylindrales bacterium]
MPDTPLMDRVMRRSLETGVPIGVHFDLTYRCNERCVHCYLDHEDHGELETPEIKRILEQLAEAGTLMLTFSGGEIFLRGDLFELLAFARRLHFNVSLKSNALLITPEHAERLKSLGIRRIQISIYSADAAVHDAITKVRGSFDRSIRAIRFLKSQGMQVKIACPLMKQNIAGLAQLQSLAEELGVPYLIDMTITPKLDGDMSVLALRNAPEDLVSLLRDPKLNPAQLAGAGSSTGANWEASAVSSGIESDAYEDIPCSAGHNSCYVSPYGDVFPCVQMSIAAGNLRKQSFQEIWRHSPQMNRVRAVRESQLPVCAGCSIRQFCERCPGLAHMEGGDLLGAYERACELAEMTARFAGVKNPVSAWHQQPRSTSAARAFIPAHLVQIAAAQAR